MGNYTHFWGSGVLPSVGHPFHKGGGPRGRAPLKWSELTRIPYSIVFSRFATFVYKASKNGEYVSQSRSRIRKKCNFSAFWRLGKRGSPLSRHSILTCLHCDFTVSQAKCHIDTHIRLVISTVAETRVQIMSSLRAGKYDPISNVTILLF